jgi:Lamin Tail Domain
MPEWIEFYNASSSAIDVGGWKISDANIKYKASLVSTHFIVQPGAYFLAASDSTLRNYFPLLSPMCVAPFSSLNNTSPDAVVLYDDRGVTMDSVWYKPSWGGTNGKSLERIDYLSSPVDSTNWKSAWPTPGAENSSAKKDFDVMMSSASAIMQKGGLHLTAVVRNVGRNSANGLTVRFYYDANGDSIASPGEMIQKITCTTLAPGDSIAVHYDWETQVHGLISIICAVDFSEDQRTSNNSLLVRAANKFPSHSIVINEIMYDPLPNYSEFVELFNRSVDTVDLQRWTIMTGASSSDKREAIRISSSSLLLAPNEYAVISADSSLITQFPALLSLTLEKLVVVNKALSLNNSGGDVVLLDVTNTQIDSVRYSPSWHNPLLNTSTTGKSLERINPALASNDRRNWSSSIAPGGATPGKRNSIFTLSLPSAAHLTLSPNPFSPDNDGFEDFLAIEYSLPSTTSMIRVRCFDVQGRLVRTLANNEPAASSGTILWNGLDDNNRRVRIGMYIILFEALDSSGGVVHTLKDVAVVAAKL